MAKHYYDLDIIRMCQTGKETPEDTMIRYINNEGEHERAIPGTFRIEETTDLHGNKYRAAVMDCDCPELEKEAA